MTRTDVIALVTTVANRHSAPTYAMVAQARIESNYDPNAMNPTSGAKGVLQIRDATAQQPGFGVVPMDPGDLYDAEANVDFGCRYLAGLYSDADVGNQKWSLTYLHFNVGPGADPNTASLAYKALAVMVAQIEGEPYPLSAPLSAPMS